MPKTFRVHIILYEIDIEGGEEIDADPLEEETLADFGEDEEAATIFFQNTFDTIARPEGKAISEHNRLAIASLREAVELAKEQK